VLRVYGRLLPALTFQGLSYIATLSESFFASFSLSTPPPYLKHERRRTLSFTMTVARTTRCIHNPTSAHV
jgi:hypothetical protein